MVIYQVEVSGIYNGEENCDTFFFDTLEKAQSAFNALKSDMISDYKVNNKDFEIIDEPGGRYYEATALHNETQIHLAIYERDLL